MANNNLDIGGLQSGGANNNLDIGALQVVAAVGVTVPVMIYHYKQAGGLCLPFLIALLEMALSFGGL